MIFLLSGRDQESLQILVKQFKFLNIQHDACLFIHFHEYTENQKNEIASLFQLNEMKQIEFCHLHSGWLPEYSKKIQNAKLIFLDGGLVKKWEYFSRIRQFEKILNPQIQKIIGVSGSAILMGESLLPANEYGTLIDHNYNQGLNLVTAHVFPHGQRFVNSFFQDYLQKNKNAKIYSIADGGIAVVENGEIIASEKTQIFT